MSTTTTHSRLSTSPVFAVLPAEDLSRARHFYGDVLGLSIEESPDAGGFFVLAGSGTKFFVYERARTTAEHTVATFFVSDLRAAMDELRVRGVVFEEYDIPGVVTTHGIAELPHEDSAWFTDSEGNIIAVSQMK
jgi:predicted enzyme related to lactoylglutathione lyase